MTSTLIHKVITVTREYSLKTNVVPPPGSCSRRLRAILEKSATWRPCSLIIAVQCSEPAGRQFSLAGRRNRDTPRPFYSRVLFLLSSRARQIASRAIPPRCGVIELSGAAGCGSAESWLAARGPSRQSPARRPRRRLRPRRARHRTTRTTRLQRTLFL